ncbi:MAG: TIGR00725 family protein [Candidatus Aminicenantes bacterium]|nr:MAG: TIGR00725 family protein [Candidatus Aminicenantes bacterium]
MELKKRARIGVIGGANPDSESLEIAFKVGQLIGEKGAILVCGGLSGIMEAAAKGAKQAEGMTIGILPGNSPQDANPYIDIAIATGMGYGRNSLVAMNADVLIAIDGQYGTLTEIAYGCIYGKKIIGIGTWDIEGVVKTETAEEAVEQACKNLIDESLFP